MTLYRIEGSLKLSRRGTMILTDPPIMEPEWTPIEEYGDPVSAETRLRYWRNQFPFRDLFNWRIVPVEFTPKKEP